MSATATGTLVRLRVQPRARTECLDGVREGCIRLRLAAPPVDGAANAACIAFLAKILGINRSGEASKPSSTNITICASHVVASRKVTTEL